MIYLNVCIFRCARAKTAKRGLFLCMTRFCTLLIRMGRSFAATAYLSPLLPVSSHSKQKKIVTHTILTSTKRIICNSVCHDICYATHHNSNHFDLYNSLDYREWERKTNSEGKCQDYYDIGTRNLIF